MHLAARLGAVVIVIGTFAACQQMPNSLLGPSSLVVAPRGAHNDDPPPPPVIWGALAPNLTPYRVDEGFPCALDALVQENGGTVATLDSRSTVSDSGKETLVCFGQATFPFAPPGQNLKNQTCHLRSGGTTTDSQIVATSSGEIVLTCHSPNLAAH